jgi:hypothetical protein
MNVLSSATVAAPWICSNRAEPRERLAQFDRKLTVAKPIALPTTTLLSALFRAPLLQYFSVFKTPVQIETQISFKALCKKAQNVSVRGITCVAH